MKLYEGNTNIIRFKTSYYIDKIFKSIYLYELGMFPIVFYILRLMNYVSDKVENYWIGYRVIRIGRVGRQGVIYREQCFILV